MKVIRFLSSLACVAKLLPLLLLTLPCVLRGQPRIIAAGPNFGIHDNAFNFTILWASNSPVVVEGCTNLGNPLWVPLGTNSIADGMWQFSDPQWTNNSRRFYRLISEGRSNYSTNIVGYANVTVRSGYSLLANPLRAGLTNGANEILPPIEGEQILTWNGAVYDFIAYDTGFGGWVDINFNRATVPCLPPGKGFFLFNPYSTTSVTFVGEVVPAPCTTNSMSLPPGYSLVGSPLPADANPIEAAPVRLPVFDGIQFSEWRGYNFEYYAWDTGLWISSWEYTVPPRYTIGEGFFFWNPGPATNWLQILGCP